VRRLPLWLALITILLALIVLPVGAQSYMWVTVNGVPSAPRVLFGAGTAAAPSSSFTLDPDTGLFNPFANYVGVAAAGSHVANFNTSGLEVALTGQMQWSNIAAGAAPELIMTRVATGVLNVSGPSSTPDFGINVSGSPTLSTCGDGALQTGSSNSSGRVVGTTQTACTLTFSATFGGNSADCLIENITANRGNVTAASSTAFTVSNLTAGDDFMYFCVGR